jgi:predicted transcriptional regulator of viral defense system
VHSATEHETIRNGAASSARLLTASELGVHPSAMARLEKEGAIERIIPGVYIGASQPQHRLIEVAAWTLRHPEAVACLLSAAVYHDLTDAFPRGIWLFVPVGTSPPRSRVVPVHAVQVTPRLVDREADAENGIDRLEVHGVGVRITGPDRTTLDLWRYPNHVSREYALDALRRRLRQQGFQMYRFARLARRLGVWQRVEPVIEGMIGR